jgi:polyisoprenoid-binding protein YceI
MLALLLPAPAAAQVQGYRLDPVHTRIVFAIDHAGFSTALGSISGSTGVVAFDPLDWSSARLDVRVPLRRVDLGDKRWNRAAARMLGSASHPEARFIASDVRAVDASHARACGTLYLHGTQQPLCLEVRFNQAGREPLPPFHQKAGFSATATLSRAAFGIDAWAALVGDEVELRIEAEAARDDAALAELPPVPRK